MKKTMDQATALSAKGEKVSCVPSLRQKNEEERTEGNVLLERDESVERTTPEKTDERATDREEDKGDVDVEDQRCRTSDRVGDSKCRSSVDEVVWLRCVSGERQQGEEERARRTFVVVLQCPSKSAGALPHVRFEQTHVKEAKRKDHGVHNDPNGEEDPPGT